MSMYNDNLLDAIAIISFLIGVANYDENLSQSDKDDMIHDLSEKMNSLLVRLEEDLENQNEMLREQTTLLKEILNRLEK